MKKLWPLLSSIPLCLLVLSGCAAQTATPTPGGEDAGGVASTEVIGFLPAVPVGDAREGSCWSNSLAAIRDDAWRCMVGSTIYDPCFQNGEQVICGADPSQGEGGFVLALSEPLPTPDVPRQGKDDYQGWLVELADGTYCGFNTGATFVVEGERADYGCTDGTYLYGDLQPGQVWTANWAKVEAGSDGAQVVKSGTVEISRVWQ